MSIVSILDETRPTGPRKRHHKSSSNAKSVILSQTSDIPPAIAIPCDSGSVDDFSSSAQRRRWDVPYTNVPVIERGMVLAAGLFVFGLAIVWPPLILLFAYIASVVIPYSFRENDHAEARRELYSRFCRESDDLPDKFQNIHEYVNYEESYWANSRGMLLSTAIMTPKDKPIKAVVAFCHGYTDHMSFGKLIEFQRLCEAGIALVAIEYEGHGRSDGALGLISDWDELVTDVSTFFKQITAKRFPNHPVFIMGESMGGAVTYCVYNRSPEIFKGVVLICPMAKISEDMLPPQYVIDILRWLIGPTGTTSFLGFLPIAPSKNDLGDLSNKIESKAMLYSRCPLNFDRNPRLATARELINVTQRINSSLSKFTAPFLVLHGKADRVTDPALSQALYNESPSADKRIKLYDDMWHALTAGEPDENIDLVFADIVEWIMKRV